MIKENIDDVICLRGGLTIAAWLTIGVLMAGDLSADDNLELPVQVQFDWVGRVDPLWNASGAGIGSVDVKNSTMQEDEYATG